MTAWAVYHTCLPQIVITSFIFKVTVATCAFLTKKRSPSHVYILASVFFLLLKLGQITIQQKLWMWLLCKPVSLRHFKLVIMLEITFVLLDTTVAKRPSIQAYLPLQENQGHTTYDSGIHSAVWNMLLSSLHIQCMLLHYCPSSYMKI